MDLMLLNFIDIVGVIGRVESEKQGRLLDWFNKDSKEKGTRAVSRR